MGECKRNRASCTTGSRCQCKTLFFYEFYQGEWRKDGRQKQRTGVRGQEKTEVRGRPSEIEKKKAFHGVKKSEGRGQELKQIQELRD